MVRLYMILNDIEGAVHIFHEYGERFEGWYFSKTFHCKKDLTLKYKETKLTCSFDFYNYNYHFIMPSRIEFAGGLITYSNGERELGIFRFPRESDGKFVVPLYLDSSKLNDLMNLPKEDISRMLSMKVPLMFEAYKIPQYEFEFFNLTGGIIEDIYEKTDPEFLGSVKELFNHVIKENTAKIIEKISSGTNYLLILKNVLNRQWQNLDELALATDEIIHI